LFQLLFVNPTICIASQASELPTATIIEIAGNYNHIFIGTTINKTVESDYTQYIFNVTEYLKHPLNSTIIYLTVGGGSEIAVSPSTSFFLDKEYIIFFDEIDEKYRIVGYDYTFTLLNSVDSDDIEIIRDISDEMIDDIPHYLAKDVAIPVADLEKSPGYPYNEQTRKLVPVALFSIAGLISILILLRKNR